MSVKVLVIETAFLGDAIIALALARAVRRKLPTSHITYVVRPDAAGVVRASPDVDLVIQFDKRGKESGFSGIRSKADELNTLGFDILFLLHNSKRSQRLSSLLNIPTKVGFPGSTEATLTHITPDTGWTTRYERANLPFRTLYPDADISALPSIEAAVPPVVAGFATRFPSLVALAPGSAWRTKKWGDERYAELARRLSERGVGILVIGGNDTTAAGELILKSCSPGTVLNLAATLGLVEAAGAIAASSMLVANDSAPTHLGVAVATHVITIFGPTIPGFGFGPPAEVGTIMELPQLWCRPCTHHGSNHCPIYSHECMTMISVDRVLSAMNIRTPNE
jgi:heptosyltransferase-2